MITAPLTDSPVVFPRPAELRRRAAADGYLYVPKLLPVDLIDALADEAIAVAVEMGFLAPDAAPSAARARPGAALVPYDSSEWIEFQRRMALAECFPRVAEAPELLTIVECLFDGPARAHCGDVCRLFLPGAERWITPPHQDLFFLRSSRMPAPEAVWSVWLPLVDCGRELGGLAVLPGSHRRGLLAHDVRDARGQSIDVPVDAVWAGGELRRGDALFVSAATVHRGLPNRSPTLARLSADYRYRPATPR